MSSTLSSQSVKKYCQSHGLATFFASVEEGLILAAKEAQLAETKALYLKSAERINNIYRDAMKALLGEK
jgi:hypothetical protein